MRNDATSSGQKSVEMREALEADAKKKGLSTTHEIARYVEEHLDQHNQGIYLGSIDYENPDDWREQS